MAETGLATRAADVSMMAGIQQTGVVPDAPWMTCIERHAGWPVLADLPMTLIARVPLIQFKIRDLLQLHAGQVIETVWSETEDIPVAVGKVKLGWCEFEVQDKRLGVRLTRLA